MLSSFLEIIMTNSPFSVILGRICLAVPYKYSSGGKPEAIPSITQEEFLETYNYNYHPSNSYIFLYGNLNVDQYLEHIDSYLNNYDYKDYSDYNLSRQNNFSKKCLYCSVLV